MSKAAKRRRVMENCLRCWWTRQRKTASAEKSSRRCSCCTWPVHFVSWPKFQAWRGWCSPFQTVEDVSWNNRGIPLYLLAGKGKLLDATSIWPPRHVLDVFWAWVPLIVYLNVAIYVSWFPAGFGAAIDQDLGPLPSEVIYHDRFMEASISASEIIYLPFGAMFVHRAMIALPLDQHLSRWFSISSLLNIGNRMFKLKV